MYDLRIEPSAVKEMAAMPKQAQRRIDPRIIGLARNPRPVGAVAMKGSRKGLLRIRVGDYRVIYHVNDKDQVVVVLKIAHRREIYRKR